MHREGLKAFDLQSRWLRGGHHKPGGVFKLLGSRFKTKSDGKPDPPLIRYLYICI